MQKCWRHDPATRPSDGEIVDTLFSMLTPEAQQLSSKLDTEYQQKLEKRTLCDSASQVVLEPPVDTELPACLVPTIVNLKKKISCIANITNQSLTHVWVGCCDGCVIIMDPNGQVR